MFLYSLFPKIVETKKYEKKTFDVQEGNQEIEVVSEVSNKSEDAEVDNLLPNTTNHVEVEKPKKEVEIKQWAVEVDVTQKMDDFHQKVPNMAKKVNITL